MTYEQFEAMIRDVFTPELKQQTVTVELPNGEFLRVVNMKFAEEDGVLDKYHPVLSIKKEPVKIQNDPYYRAGWNAFIDDNFDPDGPHKDKANYFRGNMDCRSECSSAMAVPKKL